MICMSNPKTATYMHTKYKEIGPPTTAMEIAALGGDPIFVSLDVTKNYNYYEFVFLLLHEIGHNVLDTLNERKCDLFAIRWIKKFIKEDLVKYKKSARKA